MWDRRFAAHSRRRPVPLRCRHPPRRLRHRRQRPRNAPGPCSPIALTGHDGAHARPASATDRTPRPRSQEGRRPGQRDRPPVPPGSAIHGPGRGAGPLDGQDAENRADRARSVRSSGASWPARPRHIDRRHRRTVPPPLARIRLPRREDRPLQAAQGGPRPAARLRPATAATTRDRPARRTGRRRTASPAAHAATLEHSGVEQVRRMLRVRPGNGRRDAPACGSPCATSSIPEARPPRIHARVHEHVEEEADHHRRKCRIR